MSYANKTEVLESLILKLRKKIQKFQNEKMEIDVKYEIYSAKTEYIDYCERLNNRLEAIGWNIDELTNEMGIYEKALNKEKNGNANIDPYLD
jgi:prefoldin subunit 5